MPVAFRAAAVNYQNFGTSVVTNLPAGTQVGDTIFAFFALQDVTLGDPAISGGGAGGTWNLLGAGPVDNNNCRTKVWWRKSVSGDAGAAITTSWTANAKGGLILAVYSGAHATSPIDTFATVLEADIDGTHDAPGVTPGFADCWVVEYVAHRGDPCTTITAPAGRTERSEQLGNGGGTVCQIAADSAGAVAQGVATGVKTYTFSATSGNAVGWSISLRPAITDQTIAAGQAAETDTAQPVTPVRTIPIGQAAETDTAQLIFPGQIVPIGQAVEVNAASRLATPFGRATVTETAETITPVRLVPVGQAAETDAATAPAIRKTAVIGQAAETDAGRAVAPRVALAPETLLNGVPTPLGVRIYNNFGACLDMWVTNAVDDFSFRSSIPGGFASATITLHRPSIVGNPGSGYLFNADKEQFDQLARLFNRVQIVDMRSAEIVWEGRIEGPRRSADSDTWELSCLGAAVVASDIQRPMFYIDSSIESWLQTPENFWQFSADEATKVIEVRWEGNLVWPGPAGAGFSIFKALTWQRTEECDLHIGRYDITFASSAPAGSGNQAPQHLWNSVVVYGTLFQGQDGKFDATNYTENIRHMRRVNGPFSSFGTTGGWQMDDAYKLDIEMGVGNDAAFGDYTSAPDKVVGRIANPRVQVLRRDRTGAALTDPTDYPNEYLTLPQIIEDVVGRFLVGGWHEGGSGLDVPWPGQVRPIDLYLDTSSPAVFTHLTYFDGVTAEQILGDMMNAQPGAYWAIWESRYGATDGRGGRDDTGFRFEWATWPDSWGYQASSLDGLEEQPNGEDLYNYIYFKYSLASDWNGTPGHKEIKTGYSQANAGSTTWPPGGFFEGSDLSWGRISRAISVTNDEPLETSASSPKVKSLMSRYRRTGNAGTITIRRPIHYYDPGATSYSGGNRMVQPWEIRPGKLIKITDMMPRGMIQDHSHGQTAPPEAHDGTVWRVIATEYSSSDNSCRLELDQPAAWSMPTQVTKAGKPAGPTVVKG